MKYIVLYLFSFSMMVSILPLSAQEAKRYDLALEQVALGEFVQVIEQISDYSFLYGEEVRLVHPISLAMRWCIPSHWLCKTGQWMKS